MTEIPLPCEGVVHDLESILRHLTEQTKIMGPQQMEKVFLAAFEEVPHSEVVIRWMDYMESKVDEGELDLSAMKCVARHAASTCGLDVELGHKVWDKYLSFLLEEFEDETDTGAREALKAEVFWYYRTRLAEPLVGNEDCLAGMENVLHQLGCVEESHVAALGLEAISAAYQEAMQARLPRLVLEDAVQSAIRAKDETALWQATWNYLRFEGGRQGRPVRERRLWERATLHLRGFAPFWETYAQKVFRDGTGSGADASLLVRVLDRGLRLCPHALELWRLWSYGVSGAERDGDNGDGEEVRADTVFRAMSAGKMQSPDAWLRLCLVGIDGLLRKLATLDCAVARGSRGGKKEKKKNKKNSSEQSENAGELAAALATTIDGKYEWLAATTIAYYPTMLAQWWGVVRAHCDFLLRREEDFDFARVETVLGGALGVAPLHTPVYVHYIYLLGSRVPGGAASAHDKVRRLYTTAVVEHGLLVLVEEWCAFERSVGASAERMAEVAKLICDKVPAPEVELDLDTMDTATSQSGDEQGEQEQLQPEGADVKIKKKRDRDACDASNGASSHPAKVLKKHVETSKDRIQGQAQAQAQGQGQGQSREVGVVVHGLPVTVTEADVKLHFASTGDLKRVRIHTTNAGRPRGSAVVHYFSERAAAAAIAAFHKAPFPGVDDAAPMSVALYVPAAKQAGSVVDACTAFITGLVSKSDEESVKQALVDVGPVQKVVIIRHKVTGASTGRALVQFSEKESLQALLKSCQEGQARIIDGVVVTVKRSKFAIPESSVKDTPTVPSHARAPALPAEQGAKAGAMAAVKGFKPRAIKMKTKLMLPSSSQTVSATHQDVPKDGTPEGGGKGNDFFRQFL